MDVINRQFLISINGANYYAIGQYVIGILVRLRVLQLAVNEQQIVHLAKYTCKKGFSNIKTLKCNAPAHASCCAKSGVPETGNARVNRVSTGQEIKSYSK